MLIALNQGISLAGFLFDFFTIDRIQNLFYLEDIMLQIMYLDYGYNLQCLKARLKNFYKNKYCQTLHLYT